MPDILMTLMPDEAFMFIVVCGAFIAPFTRPRCRHQWRPFHHSYVCDLCGERNREY